MKKMNYKEVEVVVEKVCREVREKREKKWEEKIERDGKLREVNNLIMEINKEVRKLGGKVSKVRELIGKMEEKYRGEGRVNWYGNLVELGLVCMCRMERDYVDSKVREKIVLWNMEGGEKVEEMIEKLVEELT